MQSRWKTRYTVGLVDLNIVDRARISLILDEQFAAGKLAWLVLYTESCNLLIVPHNYDAEPIENQIIARLSDEDTGDGQLTLRRPVNAESLIALLEKAEYLLTAGRAPEFEKLRVTGVEVERPAPRHTPLSAPLSAPRMFEAVAANDHYLLDNAMPAPIPVLDEPPVGSGHPAPVTPYGDTAGYDRVRAPDTTAQPGFASTFSDATKTMMRTWSDVAIALYSVMQNEAPVAAEIDFPTRERILIDFQHKQFQCRGFPGSIPLHPKAIRMRSATKGTGAASIVTAGGQPLDQFLWFVGKHAFDGNPAFWLCPHDRYQLARWPNFTQLGHDVDDMRMTAMLGNRFLNFSELAQIANVTRASATNLINAYSLMGLLKVAQHAPEDIRSFSAQKAESQDRRSGGLLGKLIRKLGF